MLALGELQGLSMDFAFAHFFRAFRSPTKLQGLRHPPASSLGRHLPDLRCAPGRVPDPYYLNSALFMIDSVDNPTRSADHFSQSLISELWDNSPGLRKIG